MDGQRVEMTIEKVESTVPGLLDKIVFHMENRENGEIRSIVFTPQEVFNKMFRARRWWKESRFIIDNVILERRKHPR